MASVWIAVVLLLFYIAAVPGAIGYITRPSNRGNLHTKTYLMKYGFLYNGYEEGCEKPFHEAILNRVEELGLITALFTQSPSQAE